MQTKATPALSEAPKATAVAAPVSTTTNPFQRVAAEEEEAMQMKAANEQLPPGYTRNPLQMRQPSNNPFAPKPSSQNPLQPKTSTQNPLQPITYSNPFQRKAAPAAEQQQPKKENNTGLPDNLKQGVEALSGYSMDDVKVHYNSDKPAQLQALAYAQGTDIHVAPGQEQHLPHEAWHVVQQKQGRVQPTVQMKQGIAINDDKGLENEADVMGKRSVQRQINNKELKQKSLSALNIQRQIKFTNYKPEENKETIYKDDNQSLDTSVENNIDDSTATFEPGDQQLTNRQREKEDDALRKINKGQKANEKIPQVKDQPAANSEITPAVEKKTVDPKSINFFTSEGERKDFSKELDDVLPAKGKPYHRTHTVSFALIQGSILTPLNNFFRYFFGARQYGNAPATKPGRSDAIRILMTELKGIFNAVFPESADRAFIEKWVLKGEDKPEPKTIDALSEYAKKLKTDGKEELKKFETISNELKINLKNSLTIGYALVTAANNLLDILNNSVYNLTYGFAGTNSSVGSAIDTVTKQEVIKKGDFTFTYMTKDLSKFMENCSELTGNKEVYVPTHPVHIQQITSLITEAKSEKVDVVIFSHDGGTQSSTKEGETKDSVTSHNVQKSAAIPIDISEFSKEIQDHLKSKNIKSIWYLFTIEK